MNNDGATGNVALPTTRRLREPIEVVTTGFRGIPGLQGGIEAHAQHLYPRLVELGCRVEVAVRAQCYVQDIPPVWQGVTLRRVWAPRLRGVQAFVHTFFAVLCAGVTRPDLVHLHAVGPAIMTPIARCLGLTVVFTHHGPDYEREKWGGFARWLLRTGERFGVRFSNQCIAVSRVIAQRMSEQYGRRCAVIPNGATLKPLPETDDTLREFGLERRRYVIQVSRFVEEKRQLDLIRAFRRAGLEGWRLVLVGAEDEPNSYADEVRARAREDGLVVLTGFQTGLALDELYAHAGLFVLPSSHEGLPIALLEALSFGLTAIASDIPANREVALDDSRYFAVGDIDGLVARLHDLASQETTPEMVRERRAIVADRYDWSSIAERTLDVYRAALTAREER